eukprot:2376457-Rhodomonas_salina.1
MVRSLSFISDTFGITANAMGTEEPERTIASLTEQHVDYMFNGSALPGLVVHDAAQVDDQALISRSRCIVIRVAEHPQND